MKYPYPRIDQTIRISDQLHHEIKTMAHDLDVTIQDICCYCLLMVLDPTAMICPDWEKINAKLTQ